ncbi:MAG: Crp/Fnr family transcriptional regulator [Parvibaculum sp.]
MSLATEIRFLQAQPLFSGLDPVRLEVLAFTAARQQYEAGATVFMQGSQADAAYLITSGEAVLLDHDASGQARARRVDAGDLIGENALFKSEIWRASLRAVTPIEMLRISRDMFHRLMGEFPEMAGQIAATIADRLEDIGQALAGLGKKHGEKEKQ